MYEEERKEASVKLREILNGQGLKDYTIEEGPNNLLTIRVSEVTQEIRFPACIGLICVCVETDRMRELNEALTKEVEKAKIRMDQ